MNYALELLEKEINVLQSILSKWEEDHYPEARKLRDIRLKSLLSAIEKLTE